MARRLSVRLVPAAVRFECPTFSNKEVAKDNLYHGPRYESENTDSTRVCVYIACLTTSQELSKIFHRRNEWFHKLQLTPRRIEAGVSLRTYPLLDQSCGAGSIIDTRVQLLILQA